MYKKKDMNRLINTVFTLTQVEREKIQEQKLQYKQSRAASVEALKIVQKYRGWISTDAIHAIAKFLNISSSDLEEVATFYSNIYRQPVGRNIIKYCDSMVCYVTGYFKIKCALEQKLRINSGETTIDNRFTLLPACCLGCCDRSPVVMINEDTHCNLTVEKILNLLEKYL
ncbi:MAG: NADH-quinone oxidoreductase subunit NuoE [Buchnera aphidicola (Eriosoma harunire)]